MPDRIDCDQRQHAVYARWRALPEATKAMWMRVFAAHVPTLVPHHVQDRPAFGAAGLRYVCLEHGQFELAPSHGGPP